MLRRSPIAMNAFMQWARSTNPATESRNPIWYDNPHRAVKYKKMYFTLGLDSQPLRRSMLINNEKKRLRGMAANNSLTLRDDPTGFKRARRSQLQLWKRRMHYQEWYLQHLFTRHVWGLLRRYPVGGGKISGRADKGYFGYDSTGMHRFTHENLAPSAAHIYPRRK